MPLRYTVRFQPNSRCYRVWDNASDKIASVENRDCVDLSLENALNIANGLNIQIKEQKEI